MTIKPKDLINYGYTYDGMDGLNRETALEAFDKGKAVFLLYPDNTEGLAITRDEIEKFDGLFGIEKQKYTNGKSPTTYIVMDSIDDYTLLKREINENFSDPTPFIVAYKFKTYNGNKCDWARGIYVTYLDKAEHILREKTFTNSKNHDFTI